MRLNRVTRGTSALIAALALAACGDTAPGRAVIGFAAPSLAEVRWVPAFPMGEEPSVWNEAPLLGKVVLLDFYASWCPGCVTGARDLVALRDAHASRGLTVIAVTEETVPTAMQFASQQGWYQKVPVAVDDRGVVSRAYGATVYPTQVLVDRRGIVRWRGAGATRAQLDAEIRALLGDGAPAGSR